MYFSKNKQKTIAIYVVLLYEYTKEFQYVSYMSKLDYKSHLGGDKLFKFIEAIECKISTLQNVLIYIQS